MTDRTIPIDTAWQLAFAALRNAQRLLEASRLLLASGLYGPSRSLAISSREEQGKFFSALMVAIELGARPTDPHLGAHSTKQTLGLLLARVLSLIDGSGFALDLTQSQATSIDALVRELGQHVDALAQSCDLAGSSREALERDLATAVSGAHERERQRGLYVDARMVDGSWKIQTPEEISEQEAAQEIATAATFLIYSEGRTNW